jgi:hypothetical protein
MFPALTLAESTCSNSRCVTLRGLIDFQEIFECL